jgi:protein Tex
MVETAIINLQHLARGLGLPVQQIQATVELLDGGNTVPFITRYRKDQTGGLDEEQIRHIQDRLTKMRLLAERKQTILRSIEAQGKLTEKLAKQIEGALTTKRLEDLYLPYKPKKQTLATLARSRGLDVLAEEILVAAPTCADLDARAADFVNTDRGVTSAADALLGAGHILAEQFSERAELRQKLREIIQRTGKLISSQIPSTTKTPTEKTPPAAETLAPTPSAETRPGNAAPAPLVESVLEPDVAEPTEAETPATAELPAETLPPAVAEAEVESAVAADSVGDAAVAPTSETPAGAISPAAAEPQPAPAKESRAKKKAEARQERAHQAQLKKQQILEKKLKALADYFDYTEEIKRIPPHRVLAINRGERSKILRVRIESDTAAMDAAVEELLVPPEHPHAEFLRGCARDAMTRLILPSLEREIRRELTDKAELHAVSVFARNLRNLLLQPPVHDHRVLAVDPGFKSGCKLVALDQFGNVLDHAVIYLVGKSKRKEKAKEIVADLVDRFQLRVAVIGNGTASRETEDFFANLIDEELKDRGLAYVIVNEAGASVYSTSRLGREEFPHYDATLRGAISIGRRLQEPLSELVKIDPASIGVGLYQHDVKAKHLRVSLDEVVESCVNYVGVNVNMASPALLRYVSGLNQLTARRVYEHRLQNGPFRNRIQLKAVAGFGDATFVQAAGFLKIGGGDQPLDATWIHPESYAIAERVLARLECTIEDLNNKEKAAALAERIRSVNLAELAAELGVGILTLKDILAQLARPGRDPREDLPAPILRHGVIKLENLTPGMELAGTVLNVVDFGAFVDIGMHDSGLVHVSQLANKFVQDPHEVIAVGDIVKVWVVEVDKERRRVSLTMIPPGTKKPERHEHHKPATQDGHAQAEGQGERRPPARPSSRPPARPRSSSDGKPRGKGAFRGKGHQQEKVTYRPKPAPKPVVPITDKMKSGAEPMRTFGDLAQFFQAKEDPNKVEPKEKK